METYGEVCVYVWVHDTSVERERRGAMVHGGSICFFVSLSFLLLFAMFFFAAGCTCTSVVRYILQLEQIVLLWKMKDNDVERLQQKNRELQHLVDSSQRLRKQEEDRHEEARKVLDQKVQSLVKEIDRITPNEEVSFCSDKKKRPLTDTYGCLQ